MHDSDSLTRREFLQTSAVGSFAAMSAMSGVGLSAADAANQSSAATPGRGEGGRPNVLWIMTDQHWYGALGCAGHPLVRTPNIDALAGDGVFFEQTYCPAPVCAPARACLFTGYYPRRTQVFSNHQPLNDELDVLPEQLRQAGMQTAMVGKLHFTPLERSWGFEWRRMNNAMYNIYAPEAKHSDYITWAAKSMGVDREALVSQFEADENSRDWYRFYMGSSVTDQAHHYNTWTADESIRFLTQKRDGRPFFLFSSFFGPHQPMLPPEPWSRRYRPEDVELIPQLHADTADKPIFQAHYQHKPPRSDHWSDHTYQTVLAAYLGQISQIDADIGRIIHALKKQGLYDNTLIVFAADHGDHYGQYGMLSKGTMYEGAARVPMVLRDPQLPRGVRSPRVVNTLDLYRTLLNRCGVKAPADAPSRDLRKAVTDDKNWIDQTRAVLHHRSLLRRDQYKLMRHDHKGKAQYEFYDLSDTPTEMVNLGATPGRAQVRSPMRRELDRWHEKQQGA